MLTNGMIPESSTVQLADVQHARRRLAPVIRTTPVLPSSFASVYLKAESLQVTGSFKVRPAYNQLAQLPREQLLQGIVTSSSGNFAQAAAYSASLVGASIKIVMMQSSNPVKVERTRKYGGVVVFCADRFEARSQKVGEIVAAEGRQTIHPYDHPAAIAGNGTVCLEILEQFPDARHIVVPVSGGGLIAGIALTAKTINPGIRIWGVQAAGSDATYRSFRDGCRRAIERADTAADGLTVTQPGLLTFPLIQQFVDSLETVEEETILAATRDFLHQERLVVEPSGAITMAAVWEGKVPADNTILVLSGGNIDPLLLRKLSNA